MSASEKLKALDGALRGESSPSLQGQIAAAMDAQPRVLAALPQIVAVVEAAEKVMERRPETSRPIPAALAALEKALT